MLTQNYDSFDRYLKAVVCLLEGTVGRKEHSVLSDYLHWHRRQELPAEFEDFLKQLYFRKCGRQYQDEWDS